MLDIVHYFFESDVLTTPEVHEAKTSMRQMLYRDLYGREYAWGDSPSSGAQVDVVDASGDAVVHKPYIPPTPVDPTSPTPFGNVLDAPLG